MLWLTRLQRLRLKAMYETLSDMKADPLVKARHGTLAKDGQAMREALLTTLAHTLAYSLAELARH